MTTRIRRSRPSQVTPPADLGRIEVLMKSISDGQTEINRLTYLDSEYRKELMTLMQKAKLTTHTTPVAIATITQSAPRTTNTVDPQGFRKLVPNDKDFYGAITVSITQAKKILSEKALARITTSTTGEPGQPSLKVVTRGS